jgi:Domain of Unknown Function (DUF748)
MTAPAAASAHRPETAAHEHRIPRAPLVTLGILVALIIVLRLILDPLATHETRAALDQLEGFKGDFQRVHVTVFGPGYDITHLKLIAVPAGADKEDVADARPLVYVDRLHVGIDWRALLHFKLQASLRLTDPKFTIAPSKAPSTSSQKPPDLSDQLEKVTALKVDRIEIVGGEVLFHERAGAHEQQLWLHHLELTAQNLATRPALAHGRPATVSAHGVLGRSGDLDLFVSADPFASPLSFAGQLSEKGLRASELYEFIEPKTHLQAARGTIDVFAEFVSKDGLLTGGVKPVVKNVEIRPTEPGVWDRMKAWLADKAVRTVSDRVPDRNAVATTVPLKGKLTDPDVQLWPTVLGVIRNAFVQGLASGFENLPPATADKKEGKLEQAKNAVKKDKGPPKAQPNKS